MKVQCDIHPRLARQKVGFNGSHFISLLAYAMQRRTDQRSGLDLVSSCQIHRFLASVTKHHDATLKPNPIGDRTGTVVERTIQCCFVLGGSPVIVV